MTFDRTLTDDLMAYIAASPSQYHAVAEAATRLDGAGFRRVEETAAWDTEPGGRYAVRDGSLIAWFLPPEAPAWRPFRIAGSHTDSTGFRVKPAPDTGTEGWRQIAVEVYGAPIYASWTDRDLGLAGRLVLRDGTEALVNAGRPLLRIPLLAIHLDREVNQSAKFNPQTQLMPVWGLGRVGRGELVEFLAAEASVPIEQVVGWDLMPYDVNAPTYLGRDRELVAAARLDNLSSVHASIGALIDAAAKASDPTAQAPIPVIAALDHEETGSISASGASGPFLETVLARLVEARGGGLEARARAFAGSVVGSADLAHAVHPNYPEKHDPDHRPRVNGGPALKLNADQHYATNGATRAVWLRACAAAGVPTQDFVSRNDVRCGTTIGPLTAARLGIPTFDVGIPSLGMHSVRELCGADDPWRLAAALAAFLSGA
jgi:aspartyl aminopeptidase